MSRTPRRPVRRRTPRRVLLKPELVPKGLWGRSVYAALRVKGRRRDWEAIRRTVFDSWKDLCSVCKVDLPPGKVCHEEWEYEYSKRVATLVRFRPLCPMCNFAIHLGRTVSVISLERPEILEQVMEHMCTVNSMTRNQVEEIASDAAIEWMLAPEGRWKVNIAPGLIAEFPALKGVKL
jgi:hypothetical protein